MDLLLDLITKDCLFGSDVPTKPNLFDFYLIDGTKIETEVRDFEYDSGGFIKMKLYLYSEIDFDWENVKRYAHNICVNLDPIDIRVKKFTKL